MDIGYLVTLKIPNSISGMRDAAKFLKTAQINTAALATKIPRTLAGGNQDARTKKVHTPTESPDMSPEIPHSSVVLRSTVQKFLEKNV